MSQNDFVIANASGATVRSDINSALQALASLSSGASAPGTTYANQWWHDDTNDILKIRDEANTTWINAFSKVGTTWIPYNSGTLIGTMANLAHTSITENLVLNAKNIQQALTTISSGTPNFATSGNTVSVMSTATANTLGTVQAGFIGVVHYGVAITVTHNATSRILPTGANITTTVGDVEIVVSLGSGNWRTISYMRADGSSLGGAIASQAEVEAASINTKSVSPGRVVNHPGVAKHWVNWNGSGTPATRATWNFSSITDNAVGDWTMNWATAMSSANYVASGFGNEIVSGTPSGTEPCLRGTSTTDMTTTSMRVHSGNVATGGLNDTTVLNLKTLGDF